MENQTKTSQPLPPITPPSSTPTKTVNLFPIIAVIVVGIISGILLKQFLPIKGGKGVALVTGNVQSEVPTSGVKVGDIYGNPDATSFKDSTSGVLETGGLNGEGTHKLLRTGGASQTVYLTSSVVDLDEFVGHQITVWGETFSGSKAGWLMDVGRVKVDVLNAPTPE